jgi:hypothetical protein
MEKARQTRKVAPDGGYGWVATFGVSLVNVSIVCLLLISDHEVEFMTDTLGCIV